MRQEDIDKFENTAKELISLALDLIGDQKKAAGPTRPLVSPALDPAIVALESLLRAVTALFMINEKEVNN